MVPGVGESQHTARKHVQDQWGVASRGEKQTRMKRGSETQRLLTVSVLDLLNTVLEDFRLGGIFNLGDKTFHVDDNFPGVGLADRLQDQRQRGFEAGNLGRQDLRVCRRSEINVAHFLS